MLKFNRIIKLIFSFNRDVFSVASKNAVNVSIFLIKTRNFIAFVAFLSLYLTFAFNFYGLNTILGLSDQFVDYFSIVRRLVVSIFLVLNCYIQHLQTSNMPACIQKTLELDQYKQINDPNEIYILVASAKIIGIYGVKLGFGFLGVLGVFGGINTADDCIGKMNGGVSPLEQIGKYNVGAQDFKTTAYNIAHLHEVGQKRQADEAARLAREAVFEKALKALEEENSLLKKKLKSSWWFPPKE